MKSIIGGLKALSVCVLMCGWACAPAPRCFNMNNPGPRSQPYQAPVYTQYRAPQSAAPQQRASSPYIEEGICSFSGQEQQGTRMANGELFNMHRMIAAHRSLPFGTVVKVTNLTNSRSVIVEIKDRGPSRKGRIIDISYGAAKKLDMLYAGIVPARVEMVKGEWKESIEEKPDIIDIAKAKLDELVEKIINRNQ